MFRMLFVADGGVVKRRCALLSLGCLKRIFMRTLSISVRGAVRSVLRTSPSSRPGRWTFARLCVDCSFNGSILNTYRENALIIHYTRNDHLLRDGELVLIDAGGEYKCAVTILAAYSPLTLTDIDSGFFAAAMPPTSVSNVPSTSSILRCRARLTHVDHPSIRTARTFPVNGTFTPPQRELYSALLTAQKALVKECAVARGHSLESLHRRSVDLLRAELAQVGIPCAGPVLERVLYPHYLAHPIGIGKFSPPSVAPCKKRAPGIN